ncbi:hypothetical protein YC2023_104211 [Brassica napus]
MADQVKERTLEETSTWAVAVVCFVLLFISIVLEHSIHKIGSWFKQKHKKALYEALEKVKAELMLLGFISLLLTIGQTPISNICISQSVASSMHPCSAAQEAEKYGKKDSGKKGGDDDEKPSHRLLLELAESFIPRRSLATKGYDKCAEKGKVAFVSAYGIHQLHIFIFVLAVVHVIYCIVTYALGKTKMRRWKQWENETKTIEYQYANDPERFRQFLGSVTKVDYLALRHGFITSSYLVCSRAIPLDQHKWTTFLPLATIHSTSFGTKLQVIITKLGLRIQEKGDVVRGAPVVQPGDDLFWFGRPRFILFLIHLVLFTNAFQLAFFAWSTYEFNLKNCFHESNADVVIRIVVGVVVQILCSYVTLPLYALVTQMGTKMKPTVFNERVATALKKWHHTAKKQTKHGRHSESTTPYSSRPTTPTHGSSPIHLLHNFNHRSVESFPNSPSPRYSSHHDDHQFWDPESQRQEAGPSSHHSLAHESSEKKPVLASVELPPIRTSKSLKDFSFKR